MFYVSLFLLQKQAMVSTSTFHGKFMYYENVNGKEKKVAKEFTDPKKFNEFTKKYPMPSLGSMFGLIAPSKKALPVKWKVLPARKSGKAVGTKAKKTVKKKK